MPQQRFVMFKCGEGYNYLFLNCVMMLTMCLCYTAVFYLNNNLAFYTQGNMLLYYNI